MTIPTEWILFPLAAILAYLPCLNGPFLFDDRDAILHNTLVAKGNWRKLLSGKTPRVITQLSYAMQSLWPGTSRSFHIANALIHAFNGWIAYRILETQVDGWQALMGATLFVVGPFAVNAVGFVTGRAAMLAATFGYLGVWAILAGQPLLAIPCAALAIFAKEDAAAFALTFTAVSWIHGDWFWLLWVFLPTFTLIPYLYVHGFRQFIAPKQTGDTAMTRGGLPGSLPFGEHAVTVLVETLLHYPCWVLGLKQAPYHGSGFKTPSPLRICAACALTGVFVFTAVQWPALRLGVALLLLGPWLAYVLVPIPDQLFEHRNYASAIGIPLLVAPFISTVWIWTAVLAYATINTMWQAQAWSDGKAMWTACIRRGSGEKSRAYQEIGALFKIEGNHPAARPYFHKALELNPRLAPAMRNMAWMAVADNQVEEGIQWLERCVAHCPLHPIAHEELGRIYELSKRFEDAERCHQRAIELDPRLDFSQNKLGMFHFQRGDFVQAQAYFDRARQLAPTPDYVWNWAYTTRELGDKDRARQALQLLGGRIQMTDSMIVPKGLKTVMA